ncbi:MAG: hypothetical protein KIT81_08630 [Alphaproteobacteria bacterium]|nr:hypothetical protein [Alphaproteobacteria bacterium]MCW5751200.1 hypothetical protein [Alphaproteobacteria bacterium]
MRIFTILVRLFLLAILVRIAFEGFLGPGLVLGSLILLLSWRDILKARAGHSPADA